jgi:hypothetical protein
MYVVWVFSDIYTFWMGFFLQKTMKKDTQNLLLGHRVGKKTKKRQRKLDRALGVLDVIYSILSMFS